MKKKVFFSFLTALIPFFYPVSAYAQIGAPEEWGGECVSDGVATIQGFECLFVNIVRILTPIFGLALFIMLAVGAFQMITSGGDPKQAQKARQTLTYAIFGIVAFVGVWFILILIRTITGVDVTKFEIPGP